MTTIRLPVIAAALAEPAEPPAEEPEPAAPEPEVYVIHCAPSPRLDATDLERLEIVDELPEGTVRTFLLKA